MFSFYGVTLLGVYLLGDRFGGSFYTYRIVIIGIVLLTLPFALVGSYFVSRRNKKAAKAEEEAAAAAAAGGAEQVEATAPAKLKAPTGKYDELTTSAEEVVQFLKSSNVGGGKDAVYALPWYVVMGPPKSGKSSLVLSSALNFQNLPSQRQSEQKFLRPTRSVDWRVTSDAVFLDTAGRYQTEGVDQDEWAGLLDILKKYRGQRPLDGMILSVSAERILHADEAEIEQMAKVLRARVDEAVARTKTKFPIYLIFTHADAIEGFRDSFSTSQREGENLVWGATIPLEQTANAHTLFDPEYELLQTSVMKRRLIRLSAPFSPVRQLKIFNFPLHFGTARRKLGAFVATLFRPNPFSESPFLRGFYFTAVPVNRQSSRGNSSGGGGGQTQVGMQTVGQSYFTEKLFRDVVLRDKDLVATMQAQKVRPPIMGWLLTIMGAGLIFLLLALAANSLYQNKKMLDAASRRGDAVLTITKADQGRNPLDKKPDEARSEIDATEELRKSLVDLDKYERDGAPILMRFGLYSGSRIYHEKLLHIYFNAIEQRFKNTSVKKLQEDLAKFSTSNPVANPAQLTADEEKNLGDKYDALKAYLMLSGDYREKAEGTEIARILSNYWKTESKVPPGMEGVAQQQLDFWAKQVDRDEFPRIKLDTVLVDNVRKKLQAFPAVYRYYSRKVTEISKEVDSKVGAKTVENVLTNNRGDTSYMEGKYQVPGAFTIEGYALMKKAISDSDKELGTDDWVMGEQNKNAIAQTTDASKLEERYLRDYADHWKAYIEGIVVKYKKEDAAKALQAFSSKNSPMEIVLIDVARNTNLSAKPKSSGWWEWIKSFVVTPEANETGGNTPVEKEFRPLFGFIGEEGKAEGTNMDKYRNIIGNVQKRVAGLSSSELNDVSKELAAEKDSAIRLKTAEGDVEKLLSGFNETPSGQALETLLNAPFNNLRIVLGASLADQIKKVWNDTVLTKAKAAEKGFPFEESQTEADMKAITEYLNPVNGTLPKFYKDNLEKYFEPVGDGVKVKENSPVKFSDEFVAYLNNALRLQNALFGKNASPSFTYDLKIQKVEGASAEVTIDGQKISADEAGSGTLKFPATSGETGAVLSLGAPPTDTNTTDTSSSSANSSSSSVNTSSNTNAANKTPSTSSPSSSGPLRFPGTWGLFKFVAAGGGTANKQPSGEYLLTYKIGGKTVNVTVKGDLFDRSIWQARAPQNILK